MRRIAGMSQEALARELDTKQTQISRIERGEDWKFSTIIDYIIALDAEARLTVSLPNGGAVVYELVRGDFEIVREVYPGEIPDDDSPEGVA